MFDKEGWGKRCEFVVLKGLGTLVLVCALAACDFSDEGGYFMTLGRLYCIIVGCIDASSLFWLPLCRV